MADHTTTLLTLIDTSHRRRSTLAQLVDIPKKPQGGDRDSSPTYNL